MLLALVACAPDPVEKAAPVDSGTTPDTTTTPADTADSAPPPDSGDSAPPPDTGDTAVAPPADDSVFIALYADWTEGYGGYRVWGWPSGDEIRGLELVPSRDNRVVCAPGDRIFLAARNTGEADYLSILDPSTGAVSETWTLDVDANPWDVDLVDGSYWVSQNNLRRIDLLDANGYPTGTFDLSPWADDQGTAQPAAVVQEAGATYVVLSGYDATRGVYGTPRLLKVDPTARTVEWALDLPGRNVANVSEFDGDTLYVQSMGTWTFDDTGATRNLDGGLSVVDLAGPTESGFVLSEADMGLALDSFHLVRGTGTAWIVVSDPITQAQSIELLDLTTWTRTPVFDPGDVTVRVLGPEEDGTFWNLEVADADGVETSAWVHRDAAFAEIERLDLGEDVYGIAVCER